MTIAFVLPVSGGGFVSQLGAIQHLSHLNPDIFLGSSGGNLAAYIASASRMDPTRIEFNTSRLSSKIFAQSWSNSKSLSTAIGYFQCSLYSSGIGSEQFLRDCFPGEDSPTYHEIWTGTYNVDRKKARFFCNLSTSKILNLDIDTSHLRVLPWSFMDGNWELVSKVSLASASIPAVVPPVEIQKDKYVDGGVFSSSPLSVLADSLPKNNLHIFYISSTDLDSKQNGDDSHNVLETWKEATNDMISSLLINDRNVGLELIEKASLKNGRSIQKKSGSLSELRGAVDDALSSEMCLLELYPSAPISIDILDFEGEEAVHLIRDAHQLIKWRMWWL